MTMPDIEGNEVLAKIKERKLKTRVIIVTGTQTSIKDVVKHIREGACDYYTKDMNITVLINQIKRALSLETTINVKVSKPAPIIEEIIAKVERFSSENEKLLKKNAELQKQNGALEQKQMRKAQLAPELVNLGGLIFCILLALVFCYFVSIIEVWIKVLLPIAFFLILKFPMDRLSKIFVKLPTSETNIELQSSEINQHQLPK
jgi:DNA-binding response OmpR family regulator